jgi:hypothetical protein
LDPADTRSSVSHSRNMLSIVGMFEVGFSYVFASARFYDCVLMSLFVVCLFANCRELFSLRENVITFVESLDNEAKESKDGAIQLAKEVKEWDIINVSAWVSSFVPSLTSFLADRH